MGSVQLACSPSFRSADKPGHGGREGGRKKKVAPARSPNTICLFQRAMKATEQEQRKNMEARAKSTIASAWIAPGREMKDRPPFSPLSLSLSRLANCSAFHLSSSSACMSACNAERIHQIGEKGVTRRGKRPQYHDGIASLAQEPLAVHRLRKELLNIVELLGEAKGSGKVVIRGALVVCV